MKPTKRTWRWKALCTFLSCFLLIVQANAQNAKAITGTVTSKITGSPIEGATVVVKGTKTTAITNGSGQFTINATPGQTLVISFIGYTNEEVTVGADNNVSVALAEDYGNLNSVVVVGYGKMKKTDQSSAQVSISASEINKTVNTTVEQALQGRAAGVYVTQNSGQPGGGISVNIRGLNSINGTNQPLYVIDGVQIQPGTVAYGATSSTNALAGLNPADIESIEILQGPSATAVYGSRATNGVVLITTKRGKAGQSKVSYAYLYSLQDKPEELPTLNLQQYAEMDNQVRTIKGWDLQPVFADPSVMGTGSNWQDALFKTAPMQKHQLNVSGGSNATTYYLSGEYFNQEGVAVGSKFDRYSFRLNMDNQTRKWLKISTNLNFYQTNEKLASTSEDVIRNALNLAPNVPVKNPNGTWGGATENEFGTNAKYAPVNPVAIANIVSNTLKKTGGIGGINADVNLLKGLVFRTSFSGNFEYGNGNYFIPSYQIGYQNHEKAELTISTNKNFYWNWNQLLQYNTTIGKHDLGVMASHESQAWNYEGYSAYRTGFVSDQLPSFNLGDVEGQTTGSYKGSGALESYIARVNYTYNNKYIVQLAGRADGSSNFGSENRWGYFPSISAAWRISEEPFMRDVTFINELKLRAEWGETGNNGSGGQYAPLSAVATALGTGFLLGQYGNEGLKWESTETKNIGFNLSVLNNRIQLEGDFYIKKTDNLLMPNPLPAYMGTSGEGSIQPPTVNIGALQNKGFGITLNTVNIDSKNGLSWRSNFNISAFRTKITKFYSDAAILDRRPWYINNFTQRSVVGQAPWLFYGYVEEGVFGSVEEIQNSALPVQSDGVTEIPLETATTAGVWVGDIKYKDLNGDGIIDERDQTFIGNPWPKFTAGFTNTFNYKGFDLSILLTGSFGNDIYNYLRFQNTNPNNLVLGQNLFAETFNYAKTTTDANGKVTLENPGTLIPRISNTDVNGNANRFTTAYVEDGSYIKIKSVQLGYNLPKNLLSKLRIVEGARLSAGVQNLATFTKYKGYDPEVGAYVGRNVGAGDQLIGVDAGRYPLTRVYTLSVNVDF